VNILLLWGTSGLSLLLLFPTMARRSGPGFPYPPATTVEQHQFV